MFTRVPPGLVVVAARRIGYRFRYVDIHVTPGDPVDGSLVLARSAQQLDTVRVTAARGFYDKPARLEYTTRYDDFYQRRRMGFGRFYTREQIDKMHVSAALDVVARVPFIRVNHSQGGVSITSGGSRCKGIVVFIDGMRSRFGAEILDMMNAAEIEAIEFYRGMAGMPPAAFDTECALFVWTR